jgi:sterol desaturase/sphingolipid hydroxylase (fatty acid hydroxylase superfamily)
MQPAINDNRMSIWETISNAYQSYANYFWREITLQNEGGLSHNYFWMLILVSVFFFGLEIWKPWRKNQPKFRKDFWLDFFYMFFNFFLFSLIIYNATSAVVVEFVNGVIEKVSGFNLAANNPLQYWPYWAIMLAGFVVRDFVQWWTHRLLHRSNKLWEFHKVHHSVEQMGFAAHLRYHWMETIVYRSIEYLPLALMGIGLHDFFLIHIFTLAWGHYNHANIQVSGRITGSVVGLFLGVLVVLSYPDFTVANKVLTITAGLLTGLFVLGPFMRKIFNSPEMHIWHHAKDLPANRPFGINFGITLAVWDYIFKTAEIPHDGKDIVLGFDNLKDFPDDFVEQATCGFTAQKHPKA